jgi:hypothetical protein
MGDLMKFVDPFDFLNLKDQEHQANQARLKADADAKAGALNAANLAAGNAANVRQGRKDSLTAARAQEEQEDAINLREAGSANMSKIAGLRKGPGGLGGSANKQSYGGRTKFKKGSGLRLGQNRPK